MRRSRASSHPLSFGPPALAMSARSTYRCVSERRYPSVNTRPFLFLSAAPVTDPINRSISLCLRAVGQSLQLAIWTNLTQSCVVSGSLEQGGSEAGIWAPFTMASAMDRSDAITSEKYLSQAVESYCRRFVPSRTLIQP